MKRICFFYVKFVKIISHAIGSYSFSLKPQIVKSPFLKSCTLRLGTCIYIKEGWDNQNGGEYMRCTCLCDTLSLIRKSWQKNPTVYGVQTLRFDEQLPIIIPWCIYIYIEFLYQRPHKWSDSKQIKVNFIFLETSILMIR